MRREMFVLGQFGVDLVVVDQLALGSQKWQELSEHFVCQANEADRDQIELFDSFEFLEGNWQHLDWKFERYADPIQGAGFLLDLLDQGVVRDRLGQKERD